MMGERSIDWKSLAIGLLIGVSAVLLAAQDQRPPEAVFGSYLMTAGGSTWVINSSTGDVWQLTGEEGTNSYTWIYAGKPPVTAPKMTRAPSTGLTQGQKTISCNTQAETTSKGCLNSDR